MNKFKKALALILSAMIFMGCVPAHTFADESIPLTIEFETDVCKKDDTLIANVYIPEDIEFDTAGYSIKYDADIMLFRYCKEGKNISTARTMKDSDEGILARSLYVSAGKNVEANDGKVLLDSITFTMLEDGTAGAEFAVIEKDADFGKKSTYIINNGVYYASEGKTVYETTAAEILMEAKAEAVKALGEYKDPKEYREAQKAELQNAINDAAADINSSESVEDVKKALEEAKAVIDLIKTDSQLTEEENAAHVHSFGEWTVVKEATCTEAGEEKRVCGCGEEESRTTEKLSHKEEIIPAVAPTVDSAGLTEGKKCSVCGEILIKQQVIAKLEGEDAEYILGDVNGDGEVNALDATQILRYANGKASVIDSMTDNEMYGRADVNGDGAVNALDATQILRFANGKSSVLK